jgi:thiol-disulfide isomerase/thioredoxin
MNERAKEPHPPSIIARRWAWGVGLLLLLTALAAAQTDKAMSAYRSVEKDYDEALAGFQKAYLTAKTVAEQQKAFKDLYPTPEAYAPRFMQVAVDHPGGPAAANALVWVVLHPVEPPGRGSELRAKALRQLVRDHVQDEKLGRLATQLVFSLDDASEEFLRAVLDKAKAKGTQARACAALAQNLKHRGRLVPRLKADPAAVARYEKAWGKAVTAALMKRDPAALLARAERLFERVAAQYGDVRHPVHGSLAKLARANLEALRRPVELGHSAPPVEGVDLAGKKLTLADYRGKVVLLDFWASGLPSCRAGWPVERALLKRLAGKPFAVLGVNADSDRKALAAVLREEKITWPSWSDGGFTGGPLATRWEVEVWPTLFLIDANRVVRKQFFGWAGSKEIEAAIDELVRETAVTR